MISPHSFRSTTSLPRPVETNSERAAWLESHLTAQTGRESRSSLSPLLYRVLLFLALCGGTALLSHLICVLLANVGGIRIEDVVLVWGIVALTVLVLCTGGKS